MPDFWMDVDASLAEVPVNILPLLDDTDFKTRETSVAYNAAGMDLVWNFITTAGAFTQTAVTPTTGGDYDWSNQGDGMYSIEIPASGGASINNDTEGFGWFTGVATGVLPWRGPTIGFRAAGLNNALIDNAYSTTRGLAGTALPDAAAEAAGGLYTRGSGAGQIAQSNNGRVDTDTKSLANGIIAAATFAASAITSTVLADGAITAAKIADGALTAAKFASGAFDAVWSVSTRTLTSFGTLVADVATAVWGAATRVLTAGTNIVLAKGVGVTGFNDLSQADVRSAVGLAAANLDTQLAGIAADAATAAAAAPNLDVAVSTRATPAQVNAEVVDALAVDTYAEPTGVPAATATLAVKLGRLHQALRNELTVDATDLVFKNDAGAALWKKPLSDDGTTYTEGEAAAP